MNQTRENKTSLFSIELNFKVYKDAMIFYVFYLGFLFRTDSKRTVDENDFHYYYGILFESTILKLLDHSYV